MSNETNQENIIRGREFIQMREKAAQDAIALMRQRDQLLEFARDILSHWPDGADLDGGDIQEIAVKRGLLIGRIVNESCNGGDPDKPCACGVYCDNVDFMNGVTCYHKAEFLQGGAA